MTTQEQAAIPEMFHWLTRVNKKSLSRNGNKWVLELYTKLPQSGYETTIYINPDQLLYTDEYGAEVQVNHTRLIPDGQGGTREETYVSNLVEAGDIVWVALERGNLKVKDGVKADANYCSNYWWNLASIAPGEGTPLAQANLSTPRQRVPSASQDNGQAPVPNHGQTTDFFVEGVVKGHCEKIVAQLAIAKLLPGIELPDGGIDWDTFRQYRDLYYHNVSNVPVSPPPTDEEPVEDEAPEPEQQEMI